MSFVENVLKVDDPVGAISVHGTCGLFGVLSVGLFADGTSNYGGSWNGVTGSVTGLFYGDASQLVAQLVGISTLLGFVFTFSFALNLALEFFLGHRVSIEAEVEGLDLTGNGSVGLSRICLPARAGNLCPGPSGCGRVDSARREMEGKAQLTVAPCILKQKRQKACQTRCQWTQ